MAHSLQIFLQVEGLLLVPQSYLSMTNSLYLIPLFENLEWILTHFCLEA